MVTSVANKMYLIQDGPDDNKRLIYISSESTEIAYAATLPLVTHPGESAGFDIRHGRDPDLEKAIEGNSDRYTVLDTAEIPDDVAGLVNASLNIEAMKRDLASAEADFDTQLSGIYDTIIHQLYAGSFTEE